MRIKNPLTVRAMTDQYANQTKGFVPEVWLADPKNVALTNDAKDLALFQFDREGVYYGHYFFNSRGKDAVTAAEGFVKEFFANYPAQAIQGLTPVDNKGARWLSRKIGFRNYGLIDTVNGLCELFILTRKEYDGDLWRRN